MVNIYINWLVKKTLNIASIGRKKVTEYKTGIQPVYNELPIEGLYNGKSNIAWCEGLKGVYSIYENKQLVYVGQSYHNLYKTIMRHFQTWNDSAQPDRINYRDRLLKHNYFVEIVICDGDFIWRLERAMIRFQKPRDNKNKYGDELDSENDAAVLKEYETLAYQDDVPF